MIDTTTQYVIVANPGGDDERVVYEFINRSAAYRALDEIPCGHEGSAWDVMKVLPNGTLTTEF